MKSVRRSEQLADRVDACAMCSAATAGVTDEQWFQRTPADCVGWRRRQTGVEVSSIRSCTAWRRHVAQRRTNIAQRQRHVPHYARSVSKLDAY